ncbi:MAG: ankyrin repeat domain-containing protein [Burkholderiaceae bacterium]|nr:ankyrin repeat domain-containing protein [Burkholderiaceae bacterium]
MQHTIHSARLFSSRLLLLLLLASLLAACASSDPHWVADRREELRRAIVEGRADDAQRLADQHSRVLGPALGLDLAVRHGEIPAIRGFLASHRVNEPIDDAGATALMRAATDTPAERAPAVIELLLEAGADAEQKDFSGRSAIDYVRDRRDDRMIAAMRRGSAAAAAALVEPVTPVSWLPPLEATPAQPAAGSGGRQADRAERARRATWQARVAAAGRTGVPHWLLGGTWLPLGEEMPAPDGIERADGSYDPWIWAGVRFHADHTGELLRYDVRDGSLERLPDTYVAWDFYRGAVSFLVLAPRFASYCSSIDRAADRVVIRCRDYGIRGPAWQVAPAGRLSQQGAWELLANAGERSRLPVTGEIRAVLRLEDQAGACAAADSRPKDRPRAGALARGAGSWHVFDPGRRMVFSPGLPQVCSQARARTAARRDCSRSGGRCVDLGGCPVGQASAVAGRNDHDWAWLACGETEEAARAQALAACRESAGCDCQLLAATPRIDPLDCGGR